MVFNLAIILRLDVFFVFLFYVIETIVLNVFSSILKLIIVVNGYINKL